jgi:hypothetical protein
MFKSCRPGQLPSQVQSFVCGKCQEGSLGADLSAGRANYSLLLIQKLDGHTWRPSVVGINCRFLTGIRV